MINFKNTRDAVTYASSKYIRGRVLDAGCGSGKYREIIKKASKEYVSLDASPEENVDVFGDIMAMPFKDESFDAVVSTQVLEHIERPWLAIGEIARVLKKGGVCFLTCPFMIPFHPDPNDYFRFSKEGLESLAKSHGLKTIESGCCGLFFTVLYEMTRFSFFNRYEKKNKGRIRKKIIRTMSKIAAFLDKFVKNNTIIYANSYIVAKKDE